MSNFIKHADKTVTLSSVGTYTTNVSTHLDGLLHAIYIDPSTDLGAGGTVTFTRATATGDEVLIATNTTKGGQWYFPRVTSVGTTGSAVASSAGEKLPLDREQIRFAVETTSGLASETVAVSIYVTVS